MPREDQYQILERSRKAAIQSLANMFDGLSKAKQLRRRFESRVDDDRERANPEDDKDDKSDFLFDMLRLNANYMNEAVKLGARYRGFAYRVLENIYAVANPGLKNQSGDQLVFVRDPNSPDILTVSRRFIVQNDVNPNLGEIEIDVPKIRNPRSAGAWQDVFSLFVGKKKQKERPIAVLGDPSRTLYRFQIPFGTPTTVTAKVDLTLCNGRKYDGDAILVRIAIDDDPPKPPYSRKAPRVRERRIPIILDGRTPKAPKPPFFT